MMSADPSSPSDLPANFLPIIGLFPPCGLFFKKSLHILCIFRIRYTDKAVKRNIKLFKRCDKIGHDAVKQSSIGP